MRENILEMAKKSLKIEAEEVADILNYLDEDALYTAIEKISAASKVITCASGTSGIAAKKFAHTLCCIEKSAQFLPPCEAVHGGLGALKAGDVMVMVSRGGKTAELFPVAEVCRKKGAYLILVSENPKSVLADYANLMLPMKIGRESDKYNFMATSSFMVTIALFDAVISGVMEKTNYQREMFALIHPGGAVGAMLSKEK